MGKAAGQQYPIIVQFWGRPKLYVDFRLGGRLASPNTAVPGSAVHLNASGWLFFCFYRFVSNPFHDLNHRVFRSFVFIFVCYSTKLVSFFFSFCQLCLPTSGHVALYTILLIALFPICIVFKDSFTKKKEKGEIGGWFRSWMIFTGRGTLFFCHPSTCWHYRFCSSVTLMQKPQPLSSSPVI